MHILIYNWKDIKNPLVGGAEVITFEYARRLAEEGHQVTWFCRTFDGSKAEEVIDGVTIIRRGTNYTTYWEGYQYYKSLAVKPDIVIDMLNTIAWQTPLYAGRQSKVIQYVNQLAKEVWAYEMNPPASWLGRMLEPLQLIPYRHQSVVTYAQSTADDLAAWGYDKQKIHQFRLGLDHSRYVPGQKADYPLFLQVCRMVKMKRPDLTVRAFAEVIKEFPDAKLALVGTGPFKEAVDQLVADLRLEKHVLRPDKDIWFFENAAGDQKVRLMQEAWCFVHPSVKEGWGMVITEAAACGTPSIATAVTGQIDSVLDGKTGILVSPDPTVDELATAMKKIIGDQPLRHKMEKACLDWAAGFDWEKSYGLFKKALEAASGIELRPPVIESLPPIKQLPTITIVTPVFNAAAVLPAYFAGIEQTAYPKELIEIIMPDGGSTDETRKIAEAHGAKIIENKLKTAEAGKSVGIKHVLRHSKGPLEQHLICMLDSDNIITRPDWFDRLVEPFMKEEGIIGAEPWEYLYRPQDPAITRYTAMIGMSDPLTMFLGNYDHLNILTGRWTDLPIQTVDKPHYLYWDVDSKMVPSLGANGAIFRASFFETLQLGDYAFDIDLLYEYTLTRPARYAKVKIGVVHLFCRRLRDFVRKQQRRIKDFHYFHSAGLRSYPWATVNMTGLVIFILSCVTVVPLLWQMVAGYRKKPDAAWLLHPIACWITLFVYSSNAILKRLKKPALADRTNWRQV